MLIEKLLRLFEWMGLAYVPDQRAIGFGLNLRKSTNARINTHWQTTAGGKHGRPKNSEHSKKANSASKVD